MKKKRQNFVYNPLSIKRTNALFFFIVCLFFQKLNLRVWHVISHALRRTGYNCTLKSKQHGISGGELSGVPGKSFIKICKISTESLLQRARITRISHSMRWVSERRRIFKLRAAFLRRMKFSKSSWFFDWGSFTMMNVMMPERRTSLRA